ncbi:MAG: hypothetical protein JWO38_4642 [Gemmataceae bacterium]|nr:hypothetical protein [Gemmataceae bacterium]
MGVPEAPTIHGGSLVGRPTRPPHRGDSSTTSLTVTVPLGGRAHRFRLLTRPLALGPGIGIPYFWMDASAFRLTRGRRPADHTNIRNCVGHWWAAMRADGLDRDPDQVRHLLLATSYAVLSGAKTTHQVVPDAYLHPEATAPEEQSLPDDVRDRIRGVVASRSRDRLAAEMADLIGPAPVPAADRAAVQQTFDGLLAHGLDLVREQGGEGVVEFVGTVDRWVAAHRKKGGQGWLRTFLNRFAYETKVAFYLCYSNVWMDLIPVLRHRHGLDDPGERFLRFWHTQKQPVELPDGTVRRDVFYGQVLSLHPLSGFFMRDPALCAVAGRFIGSDAYDRLFARGETDYTECWDLVGAILTAAHLYRQALDRQAAGRGVRVRGGATADHVPVAADPTSHSRLLDEYAAARGFSCPLCGGRLRLDHIDPVGPGTGHSPATFVCRSCGGRVPVTVRRDDLIGWFAENQ